MNLQPVVILLAMLGMADLELPARVANAAGAESVMVAGGPKLERPQIKKPAAQAKSAVGQPYSNQTRQQLEKSKRSYGELIREHEQKLADYRKDPFSQDNKGLLKSQPPDVQKKIIEGRIKELERQLERQRGELKKIDGALRSLSEGY